MTETKDKAGLVFDPPLRTWPPMHLGVLSAVLWYALLMTFGAIVITDIDVYGKTQIPSHIMNILILVSFALAIASLIVGAILQFFLADRYAWWLKYNSKSGGE